MAQVSRQRTIGFQPQDVLVGESSVKKNSILVCKVCKGEFAEK